MTCRKTIMKLNCEVLLNRSLLVDGVWRHGQLPDDLQLLPELVPLDRLQHLLRLLVLLIDPPEKGLNLIKKFTIVNYKRGVVRVHFHQTIHHILLANVL